ncbi:MAG: DUF1538 domain-containing protein [Clostridia bacterium]|nr:DUF1538 domain-containing protein [Clostridia bacterium]
MKRRFSLFASNRTIIIEKIKEAFSSVLPITLIILLLAFTITPLDNGTFLAFVAGAFLLVVGMGLFTLGADTAMMPIGQHVGAAVVKSRKIWIIMPVFFIVGVLITISEPDLQILAGQLSNTIDFWTLILAVGVGVGVFLAIAFLRIVLKIKLKYILVFCYVAVFVLSFFVPDVFVPLAFDSGGVTTGPMSVPFILAIGTSMVSLRSDKNAENDAFGLTALCSIGPIISVMILGVIFKPDQIVPPANDIANITSSKDLLSAFAYQLPHYLKEVGIALLPLVALFFLTQLFGQRVGKTQNIKILIGILYTYIGLVLFLVGVKVGFLPVGTEIGNAIGVKPYNWIIIPIGMLIGYFVVAAEPAVHVLTDQVYEITSGMIPKKALSVSLGIGVAVSVGLAFTRVLMQIPIMYFLIPGYAVALILTFVVPDIFTAIAFDSGGVASGAMTTSFLLPLTLGLCTAVGGNVALEGFGVVAMVAMTPLITLQILGLVFKIKTIRHKKKQKQNEEIESIID